MVFLTFKFVDSLIEEQEKEFDTIARAQDWLKGQRETDFDYIELWSEDGDELVSSYFEILRFKLC